MKFTTNIPRWAAQITTKANYSDPVQPTVLISIGEPLNREGPAAIQDGSWDDVLRISFWDITRPITDSRDPSGQLQPMNEEQAKQIADFIKKHEEKSIVIHCHAGISRSAAVCRALLQLGWTYHQTHFDLNGYNSHVYTMIRKQFPQLSPYDG
jgi:predicted protein tyrosine phosphatase